MHQIDLRRILAVCDEDCIGKTFEQDELCVTVSEKFFRGEKVDEKKLIELMQEADSMNLFGKKCIGIAEKEGLLNRKQVIIIGQVEHAQIYRT